MPQRIYLSRLIGNGGTLRTAFRPAWHDVIGNDVAKIGQAQDSSRHNFWIGQIETDAAQHAAMKADPRIRYISQTLMSLHLFELTTAQRDAIIEVFTWLGFPTNIFSDDAQVKHLLAIISGRCQWPPIRQAEES